MKVLLVCSAGMSTSILVNSISEEARTKNIPLEIEAIAESELSQYIDGVDIVLIGPQVRFLENNIREKIAPYGIKCDIIDQTAFGMMDGEGVLKQIISLYDN